MVSPISAGGGFTRTGIATIVDMNSNEIEVDVNEAYIARVKDGQPVTAILDAYPDWEIPVARSHHHPHRRSPEGHRESPHLVPQARPADSARHGHQGDVPGRRAREEARCGRSFNPARLAKRLARRQRQENRLPGEKRPHRAPRHHGGQQSRL